MSELDVRIPPSETMLNVRFPGTRGRKTIEFSDSSTASRRKEILIQLWDRSDGFYTDMFRGRAPNRPLIPVSVAIEGRAAVVAFMFAVLGWGKSHIAKEIGLKESTIEQYLSDFLNDRR